MGNQRLPLLHEMVPRGKFRETILEEREQCQYFPLRTKIFQTVQVHLTNGCGRLLSFLDRIVKVVLTFVVEHHDKHFLSHSDQRGLK